MADRAYKREGFRIKDNSKCFFCGSWLVNPFPVDDKFTEEDVIIDLGYIGKSWKAHNKCFLAWQVGLKLLE